MIILSLLANICKHFNYIRKRTLETLSTGKRQAQKLTAESTKINAKKLQRVEWQRVKTKCTRNGASLLQWKTVALAITTACCELLPTLHSPLAFPVFHFSAAK